jgi:NTP pyrophosphatase (non-canonical NTP hydrolase)
MEFDEYQERASRTDQNPKPNAEYEPSGHPKRYEVIPLLGLVGEVGGLLGEYKKLLRDGATHRKFQDEVAEELGDILWYVAAVATKFSLSLSQIALQNLEKVGDRWIAQKQRRVLYDENLPQRQQFPRTFEYAFEKRSIDGTTKIILIDHMVGGTTGDPLTDNAYEDDGYRYHDALHLTFAACLGWSPVLRKLLRTKGQLEHRTPSDVDEVEDGGRARVIEEAIAAAAYAYAADHEYLEGVESVDWELLRHIKRMTTHLEVRNVTTNRWNEVLLRGFSVWRQLRAHGGGALRGDLYKSTIEFIPPDR